MNNGKVPRNTSGLKKCSELKKSETLEKVEKAITSLKKKKKTINFESVAHESGLTRATLYNNKQIKERITGLRDMSKAGKIIEQNRIIKNITSEDRIKELRNEIARLKEDKKKLIIQLVDHEDLKQENQRLSKLLQSMEKVKGIY